MKCARHSDVETSLACGRCETAVCPRCLVHTDVGIRCRTCAPVRRGIGGFGSNRFRSVAIVVGIVFVAVLLIGGGSQLGGSSPDPGDYNDYVNQLLEEYEPEVTATRLVDPWEAQGVTPAPGRRFVALEVTVEYPKGREATHFVSTVHFKLIDSDDFAYGVTHAAGPTLPEGLELAPGQKTRGWVVFEMDDDTQIKAIAYGPSQLALPEAEQGVVIDAID